MSEGAIRKLKRKFILMSMGTLVITMFLIASLLYLGNTMLNRQTIRHTLNYIAENDGELIQWNEDEKENDTKNGKDKEYYDTILEKLFSVNSDYQSPEFRYATRYFAIFFDKNGKATEVKTSYIAAVSKKEAVEYGERAIQQYFQFGRFGNYYYKVKEKSDGTKLVVYLDSTDVLHSNDRLLYLALALIGFGMIVAFFIVRVISTRAIRKEIRNAELQKQFMTNASHELKTPLAVIRANTEMEEILGGETEWTQSTMRQVERMNGLIRNLVMITRAEENQLHEDAEDVDVTRTIRETIDNFQPLATQNDKKLTESVNENVHMYAEEAQIRQLCSLLVDNAIKYCDEGGEIKVFLSQKGKGITLTVSNSYAEGKNVDYTRFFERFYREDESHNVDKGGYGIGLSIAESLVRQYRGNIDVSWKNGVISFVCQLKPVRAI